MLCDCSNCCKGIANTSMPRRQQFSQESWILVKVYQNRLHEYRKINRSTSTGSLPPLQKFQIKTTESVCHNYTRFCVHSIFIHDIYRRYYCKIKNTSQSASHNIHHENNNKKLYPDTTDCCHLIVNSFFTQINNYSKQII